jgi:hypothetical protein
MKTCHSIFLYALLVVSALFPGCSPGGNQGAVERVLIRVGDSTITVRGFHEAFESGITSPSVLYSDAEALREERYRTLTRLAEELIILERARELALVISDEELALAVDDVRKDFPDDTFEQTLIENGISYLAWEKGLRRRLLMEKVIQQDVSAASFQVPLPADNASATAMDANFEAQIPVDTADGRDIPLDAPPEIAAEHIDDTGSTGDPEGDTGTDKARVPPENGSESEYNAWIARLKEQYTIEIDWKLWEEIEQEDIGGI